MVFVAQEMEIPSVPPSPTTSPVSSPRPATASAGASEAPAAAAKGVLAFFGGGGAKKSPMSPFAMKGKKNLLSVAAPNAEAVPEVVPIESANHEAPRGTFLGASDKKAVATKKGGVASELAASSSAGDGGGNTQPKRYNQRSSSPVHPTEPGPDDDPTVLDGGRKMATVSES